MAMNRPEGSFVALITPFNNDGSIDVEGFRTLLEFQQQHGTKAVLIMGFHRRSVHAVPGRAALHHP